MTTINIDLDRALAPLGGSGIGANVKVDAAWAELQFVTAGTKRVLTTKASTWPLPNGAGTIEADPTPETNALRLKFYGALPKPFEVFVQVPASGTVDLVDLERVDPGDLTPIGPTTQLWRTEAERLQAAIDAIPDGPPGPPGGSDASFAEWVSDDESLTSAAVSAKTTEAVAASPQVANPIALHALAPIAGNAPRVIVNELANPALRNGATGWTAGFSNGVGVPTRTPHLGPGGVGDFAYVATYTTAPTSGGANVGPTGDRVAVTPGETLFGSIWVHSSIAYRHSVTIGWYSGPTGGSLISQDSVETDVPANEWTRIACDAAKVAPAGAVSAAVYCRTLNTSTFGTNTIRVARAMLTRGRNLCPYRDSVITSSTRAGFAVAYGDSMTQGAPGGGVPFPTHLAGQVGVPVFNQGRGGETAMGIAIRQGGVQPIVKVVGNEIPASGSVEVIVEPGTFYRQDANWLFYGSIAGVAGILTRATGTGIWTFTRLVAGSVVSLLPSGAPFSVFTTQDLADFATIWVGHNDIDSGTVAVVLRAAGAMVERAKAQGQPYIVLGLINGTGYPAGSNGQKFVLAVNAALREAYGDTFLDVRTWLMNFGLTTASITPTAGDTAAIADGRIPPSLLHTDGIHLNEAGRVAVAKYVGAYVKAHVLTAVPRERTTGTGPYNTALFAYNLKPGNTRRLRAAIERSVLGLDNARIACLGDSTTFGQGAGGYANDYTTKLQAALVAAGLPSAGSGPVYTVDADSRIVFTGTWNPWATFKAGFRTTNTVGDKVVFTSDQPGTIAEFTYLDEGATTLSYKIDGGTAVDVLQTATQTLKTISVTGLANTTHTIEVSYKTAGTGSAVHVLWFAVRNPSGTQVGRFGISGSKTADQINSSRYYANTYAVASWRPHLTIFDVTINDARPTAVAVATYKSQIQTSITALKAAGSDVILNTPNPLGDGTNTSAYVDALFELADTNDVPILDMKQAFGGVYDPTKMADTLHPNATGYQIKATTAAKALLAAIDATAS